MIFLERGRELIAAQFVGVVVIKKSSFMIYCLSTKLSKTLQTPSMFRHITDTYEYPVNTPRILREYPMNTPK